jgi:hypothetical protein
MTFNTGNPIGSTDARDRSDNSENLDLAVNSLEQTFVDRLGVTRDTLEGVYKKSAYYRAGTFDAGYTLTNNRQTLAYGNVEYSWSGAFPKVVVAGSTPATSGGIGAGAWVDRTSETLRNDINIVVKRFASVTDMKADTSLYVGQQIELLGYYSFAPNIGGGKLYVSGDTTTADDGFLCFVTTNGLRVKRHPDELLTVTMAGAVGDGVHITEDTAGFQRAASAGVTIIVPKPSAFYGINTSNGGAGIVPANSGTKFICLSKAEIRLMSSRCNIFSNFLRDFTLSGYGPITDFYCEGLYFNSNMKNLADPASVSFPTGDNYGFGVYMVKCKNVTLKNCDFANSWYGGHNLFSVSGQTIDGCTYTNIGPDTAYYPRYAAMGADADFTAVSNKVVVKNVTVTNCGTVFRSNGGINNGQVGESSGWLFENISSYSCAEGINITSGSYSDITMRKLRFIDNTRGRLIAVSGDGEPYSRATPIKNVNISDIYAENCLNNISVSGTALFYLYASDGHNTFKNFCVLGGVANSANDLLIITGEYTGNSRVAAGDFEIHSGRFSPFDVTRSHIRVLMAVNLNIHDLVHAKTCSFRMIDNPSGCTVDVHDNAIIPLGVTNYISRSWVAGSLRNIRGFRTYAAGLASVSNGGTVAHGIIESPPIIRAIPRKSGTPYIVNAIANTTDIIFSIIDSAGAPVTADVTIAWEAVSWFEIPI